MKTKAIYFVIFQPYRWSHLLSQSPSATTGGPWDFKLVDTPQPGGLLLQDGPRPGARAGRGSLPVSLTVTLAVAAAGTVVVELSPAR